MQDIPFCGASCSSIGIEAMLRVVRLWLHRCYDMGPMTGISTQRESAVEFHHLCKLTSLMEVLRKSFVDGKFIGHEARFWVDRGKGLCLYVFP